MRPARPCIEPVGTPPRPCGNLTRSRLYRCAKHQRTHAAATRTALYDDPRWHALRAQVLREWRAAYGNTCPGWGAQGPHPASGHNPLTVDHKVPLRAGGPPLQRSNLQVLCRSCNGAKGDTSDTGGTTDG